MEVAYSWCQCVEEVNTNIIKMSSYGVNANSLESEKLAMWLKPGIKPNLAAAKFWSEMGHQTQITVQKKTWKN